jgi:hypothetical protein
MQRATDIPGYSYSTDKAITILAERYARVYYSLVTRRYVLASEDGRNVLMLDEAGLIEVAKSVSYSAFFKASATD